MAFRTVNAPLNVTLFSFVNSDALSNYPCIRNVAVNEVLTASVEEHRV